MKVNLNAEFEKNMPWYAKVAMAIGFIFIDLGMKLSGWEQGK